MRSGDVLIKGTDNGLTRAAAKVNTPDRNLATSHVFLPFCRFLSRFLICAWEVFRVHLFSRTKVSRLHSHRESQISTDSPCAIGGNTLRSGQSARGLPRRRHDLREYEQQLGPPGPSLLPAFSCNPMASLCAAVPTAAAVSSRNCSLAN